MTGPVMNLAELEAFLEQEFQQAASLVRVEEIGPMTARTRLLQDARHLRPGGTVSGPSMALLADVGFYIALLAMIGPHALSVTTSMNLNFMRKPANDDLLCDARIMKLGKRLAVGEATLYSPGGSAVEPVAHATLTYAIPPRGETV